MSSLPFPPAEIIDSLYSSRVHDGAQNMSVCVCIITCPFIFSILCSCVETILLLYLLGKTSVYFGGGLQNEQISIFKSQLCSCGMPPFINKEKKRKKRAAFYFSKGKWHPSQSSAVPVHIFTSNFHLVFLFLMKGLKLLKM